MISFQMTAIGELEFGGDLVKTAGAVDLIREGICMLFFQSKRIAAAALMLPLCLLLTSCEQIEGAYFTDPKELDISIYPGNNDFSVFHVLPRNRKRNPGFDYAGISISGKPSKNRWSTRLIIDIGGNDTRGLDYIMTIPERVVKGECRFYLQADRPLLKAPGKLLPLEIKYKRQGFLVFQSCLSKRVIKIDMGNNTAALSWIPERKFGVRWNKDGFDLFFNSAHVDTWFWETAFKVGFRGVNGGATPVYSKKSPSLSLFSGKELFYLTSID